MTVLESRGKVLMELFKRLGLLNAEKLHNCTPRALQMLVLVMNRIL